MKIGIAIKLGLLLSSLGVLSAGLTGFYAHQASRDLLITAAKKELLTSTRVLARRITGTREEIARNLQVLASHPVTLEALRVPAAAARRSSSSAGSSTGSSAITSDAQQQLATLFSRMVAANPAYLQLRLIAAADFGLERVRIDRQGAALLQVSGDDLQEKGHFSYVVETLQLPAGAAYLSPISINHENTANAGQNPPTLQLATPVTDASGKAVGVVVVNVDLNGLFALLAADLPETFRLFLSNDAGDILIHPDARRTFGFDIGRRMLVQDEFAPTAEVVAGRQSQVVFEAASGDYAEQPLVLAFTEEATAAGPRNNRLILGLGQPRDLVLAQAQRSGQQILQIVVALSLLCLVLAIVLARAVTRPINAVTDAAQRFANGQVPGRLPLRRRDEIGSLARSFQQLQGQLTEQLAELKKSQAELAHLARHDTLTGLPNRRLFEGKLDEACVHSQRYGGSVCLLFIDLDRFKAINDRFGHDAGDALLVALAGRLLALVREGDTVARLGGDEFVVLLGATTSRPHVVAIAQKLIDGISLPLAWSGAVLQVGASIGISRSPQDGVTRLEMMAKADKAMYAAKASGRGVFSFSSSAELDGGSAAQPQ